MKETNVGLEKEKGPEGPQGLQGPQGFQGVQGKQGVQGPVGPEGVEELTDAVHTFNKTVSKLKNRTIGLIAVLCVLIISLCVIGVFVYRNTQAAHTRCQSGNDFRKADRARWEYILNLSPSSRDPEANAKRNQFIKFINEADKLQKC